MPPQYFVQNTKILITNVVIKDIKLHTIFLIQLKNALFRC